jgi:hypothetical protein
MEFWRDICQNNLISRQKNGWQSNKNYFSALCELRVSPFWGEEQ